MKQSDNTNRTPANWDGTPQEDYFADWNTPPEEYPAAGRHLSPEAREEYYAERDAYYARRDAYYAQRDAYYAQREREERAADEEGEEYEEKYGEDYADDADEPEEEEDDVSYAPEDRAETLEEPKEKPKKKKRRRKGGFLRFLVMVILLSIVALVVIGKAPVRNPDNLERISGRSTVLLCGTDEDGMRTDTILLLTLDRNEGSIRLLSIPRDTYAPAYYVPKINSAYGAVGGGEKGMEQLMEQVKNVVGFMPDGYALVNLSAFVEAVDLLGGLDFDVPMDMDYDDPDQNLFIHVGRAFPLGIRQCRHRPHGGAARGDEDRHEAVAAAENARCAAGALAHISGESHDRPLGAQHRLDGARAPEGHERRY